MLNSCTLLDAPCRRGTVLLMKIVPQLYDSLRLRRPLQLGSLAALRELFPAQTSLSVGVLVREYGVLIATSNVLAPQEDLALNLHLAAVSTRHSGSVSRPATALLHHHTRSAWQPCQHHCRLSAFSSAHAVCVPIEEGGRPSSACSSSSQEALGLLAISNAAGSLTDRHVAQLELLAGLLAPGLQAAMQRTLDDITGWVLAPMFGSPAPTPPRPRLHPRQAPRNRCPDDGDPDSGPDPGQSSLPMQASPGAQPPSPEVPANLSRRPGSSSRPEPGTACPKDVQKETHGHFRIRQGQRTLQQHPWLLCFRDAGAEQAFLVWSARQRGSVQLSIEVSSVGVTACLALLEPAKMARHHPVLCWCPVLPFVFMLLFQRRQWFVRHFEAVQLAFMAWKWAWALLLCLPFVMAVVLPEHPEKLHRIHWRAQDCGLEAFVMFGLGHMGRIRTFLWAQLLVLGCLALHQGSFCAVHFAETPLWQCTATATSVLFAVGYCGTGAVVWKVENGARQLYKQAQSAVAA